MQQKPITTQAFCVRADILEKIRAKAQEEDRSISSWVRVACLEKLGKNAR